MKTNMLKRVVSGVCATVIAILSVATSVGAVESTSDTTEAEVEFSLKYLDSLPKKGEKDFDKFLEINIDKLYCYTDKDKLRLDRKCEIRHKNGTIDNFKINEKEIYSDIKQEVARIQKKVDDELQEGRVRGNLLQLADNAGFKINSDEFSRKMYVAKAIYEWVAKKISYDDESKENEFRKPQDALFVYEKRTGVCEGKANLTSLMMKIAGIPSVVIGTIEDKDADEHAYNAIYLEDKNNVDRTGWTLLDSTWGDPDYSIDIRGYADKPRNNLLQEYFPVAYDGEITFREANKAIVSEETHKICEISMSERYCSLFKYYFKIGGYRYELCGSEGKACIHVDRDGQKTKEMFQIPADIAALGIKVELGNGIRYINLCDGDVMDILDVYDLSDLHILINNSSEFSEKYKQYYKSYCSFNKNHMIGYRDQAWYSLIDCQEKPWSKELSVKKAEELMKKMDKYMQEMDQAKQKFENDQLEFTKAEKEYDKKYREFEEWVTLEKVDLKNDIIKTNRDRVLKLKKQIEQKLKSYALDVREFIDLVDKSVKDMETVKKEYEATKLDDGKWKSVFGYWNYFAANAKKVMFSK